MKKYFIIVLSFVLLQACAGGLLTTEQSEKVFEYKVDLLKSRSQIKLIKGEREDLIAEGQKF